MGKRMRRGGGSGGGRSPSSSGLSSGMGLLRKRIVDSGLEASFDADSVAGSLRNRFPEYRRVKLQPFSHQVVQALSLIHHPSTATPTSPSSSHTINSFSSSEDSPPTNSQKRHRRPSDSSEARLQRFESDRLDNLNHLNPNFTLQDSESDEDCNKSTSTSEGPDPEPAFDVTKSFLRDHYAKKSSTLKQNTTTPNSTKSKSKPKPLPKIMDIDVANEKPKILTTDSGPITDGPSAQDQNPTTKNSTNSKNGPRFKDMGGMQSTIEELLMEVIVPLRNPELPKQLGVRPMAGLLLHGPPGCGKTTLAHAIANETGVSFYKISAPEVVSGVSGASEENIRTLFQKAHRTAPSIIFIDEIDAIASKRENLQREMERRIVTQLMTCMDQFHHAPGPRKNDSEDTDEDQEEEKNKPPGYVLVIGATNRPDAVDQALRRPGRFDREISLGVPDEAARAEILSNIIKPLRLEGKFDLLKIARATPGFVGADLKSLADKAGNLAIKRIVDKRKIELGGEMEDWWRKKFDEEELASLTITLADFEEAVKLVQPSLRREGFSSIPNVTWDDVGGLNLLRKVFDRYIVQRIKHPEDYEELGINLEAGFLLFGPPGCGKTLIAKAVANQAGANFIHIKGPELLNKYVGESELEVRKIFSRARTNSPCILFFDEVDALTTRRGKEGGWVVERLLNQLLIELDGADHRQGVFVIGATNRIEVMDPAVLRPGRFGKILYVPLPDADERVAIMRAHMRSKPVDSDVDLSALASRGENLTGADLASLMNEAAMAALEERLDSLEETRDLKCTIKTSHFERALSKITPSVSVKQREYYEALSQKYRGNM